MGVSDISPEIRSRLIDLRGAGLAEIVLEYQRCLVPLIDVRIDRARITVASVLIDCPSIQEAIRDE